MWRRAEEKLNRVLTWLMGSSRNKMPFRMELLMSFSEYGVDVETSSYALPSANFLCC